LLSTTIDGQETIELPQGIYLVKLDNAVQKVLVK